MRMRMRLKMHRSQLPPVVVLLVMMAMQVASAAAQRIGNALPDGWRVHVRGEQTTCFSHSREFSWDYFEHEDRMRLCVAQDEVLPSSVLTRTSMMPGNDEGEVISITAAVNKDLVVQVHSSLSDAAANSSACLPSEAGHGQCNFRSAVALCVSHLTAEDKNCSVQMTAFDKVLLDATYGQMPRVNSGLGAFSVFGNGSTFSLAAGSSSMQFLFVASGSSGDLRFTLMDCHVSGFGNITLNGGAVLMRGLVHSRVENCIFSNNTGLYGGAVFIGNANSYVDIIDCSFQKNRADLAGGGMYIDSFNNDFLIQNVNFSNHTALHGGGLFINNENIDFLVISCYFVGNVVDNGIGGGMFLYSNSVNYIMKYCVFIENAAPKFYAGGLYLYSRNEVELHHCQFIGNKATYGGGLNGDSDNDYSLISNCYFERNEADFGGALTLYASHVFFIIQNTTFHNNFSPISGGALHFGVNNDDVLLQDLYFSNNTAAVDGGAFLLTSANINLVMRRCVFWGNTAKNSGGAIYSSIATSNLLFDACRWEYNQCALFGGAVYLGESHFGVVLRSSVMNYNMAEFNSGGGYYINRFNGGIVIENSDIIGNTALTAGGGIYSVGTEFEMTFTRVLQNLVTGGNCGGVAILRCESGLITDSNISYNIALAGSSTSADADGGGMCLEISSQVLIERSIFESNNASNEGGGLVLQQASNITVRHSSFISNRASNGGSIGIHDSEFVSISDVFLSNSSAANNGGGIFVQTTPSLLVSNSRFIGSQTSTGFGSSIWASFANKLAIADNLFQESVALEGAGTIYWVEISMEEPQYLSTNTFKNCRAVYGETIATEGFKLELNSSVVNIFATSSFISPLNVTLLDYYDHRVYTDSKTTVYMSAVFVEGQCLKNGYLTGGTSEIFSRGVAVFDSLQVHCQPNAYFNVSLSANSDLFEIEKPFNFFLEDCVLGEIRDEEFCVMCPQGFYSFDPTATDCLACPDDAMCPGGSVMDLRSGFWRQTQLSHDVLECTNMDNCLGGTEVAEQCREGHEGLLCNVCVSGYALAADNSCAECVESSFILASSIISSCLFVIGVIFFLKRKYLILKYEQFVAYFNKKTKNYDMKSFKTKGKILFSFFQIISAMPTALNLFYPNPFSYTLEFFSLTNINFFTLFSLGCVFPSNFFNKLRLFTLGPIVLAATGVACLYVKEALAKLKSEDAPTYTFRERNRHRRFIIIIIGFLFFSPTSVVVFQTFVCETFEDGTQALVADSSVKCYTPTHISYIVYACFMVLVYPIGLPLFYSNHLYRRRDKINPPDYMVIRAEDSHLVNSSDTNVQRAKIKLRSTYDDIQNLRFIYGSYLPKHMYFEVIDCGRRLCLTALPILVLRSTVLQIVLVLLISLFFNAVYMELKPFVSSSDNKVAILCQWVITLTLIGSLCLRVDMTDEFSFGPEAIGIFLTVMISGIMVYTAVVSVVPMNTKDGEQVNIANSRDAAGTSTDQRDSKSSLTGGSETQDQEDTFNPLSEKDFGGGGSEFEMKDITS